ncbi:MAG TPA: hypothetical protein VN604_00630 [Nitrospirota bacterium]|nr:hypothetical protein [Nitrospirota bacterium]
MGTNELWHFLASLGLCMAIAITIISVIHRRFQIMMVDLCEGEARARFWTPAIEAWFFLSSITASLTWRPDGLEERQLFLSSICLVKDGLSGMSNSIILFSAGLITFVLIRKFKGKENTDMQKETA